MLRVLLPLVSSHLVVCVDDLISIERLSTVVSAREAWQSFAALCGWGIPLAKSPEACQTFRALGVFVNLGPLPHALATIKVCERKIEALLE